MTRREMTIKGHDARRPSRATAKRDTASSPSSKAPRDGSCAAMRSDDTLAAKGGADTSRRPNYSDHSSVPGRDNSKITVAEIYKSALILMRDAKKSVGQTTLDLLVYDDVLDHLVALLAERLREEGLSEAESASIASDTVFRINPANSLKELNEPVQIAVAVELAVSAVLVARHASPDFRTATSSRSAARLFADRDVMQFPTAESFLKQTYQGRLGLEGDLTITELRKRDRKLVLALEDEFSGSRRKQLRKLFPSPRERSDAKLRSKLGYVPQGDERRKALTVLARGEQPGGRRRPLP